MDKMEIGQEEKSRKKLLVPLIVLLLCAVSLTGAAYAYNSTVTNVENNVHVEGVTLDLKNGENAVSEAIYDINVAYGPHNTQGKAVKYVIGGDKIGFKNASTIDNVGDDNNVSPFADGYYVETSVAIGDGAFKDPAKYQSVVSYNDVATLKAATEAKGVYKVGNDYTLTLDNKSDKAVTLKMKGEYKEEPGFTDGVKDIYLVFEEQGDSTKTTADDLVKKVVSIIPAEGSTTISETEIASFAADSAGTSFLVSAYIVCSDYYYATMPVDLDKDYGFVLQFTAATA